MGGRWTVEDGCATSYDRQPSADCRPTIFMKFKAEIVIMPHQELLDPQGKAVSNSMKNLNISGVEDIRIGKHLTLLIEATSEAEAASKVDMACKKLLANPIMETYTFHLSEV